MQLDVLDELAARSFEGFVVRKDLVRKYSRQYPVPTYVVEFMLGRYCASTDPAEIEPREPRVRRRGEKVVRVDCTPREVRHLLRRLAAAPAVGVLITATLTAPVAIWVLGLNWPEALLVGAVVASTDAAAVFYLLHAKGLRLRPRVSATLEVESATNDPFAIFLTMLLGGIWHGAHWTFAIWGAMHGAYLVTNHLWRGGGRRMPDWLSRPLTLAAVLLAWVPFRADGIAAAGRYFQALAGAETARGVPGGDWQVAAVALLALFVLFQPAWKPARLRHWQAAILGAGFFLCLLLLRETALNLRQSEFIYFRF